MTISSRNLPNTIFNWIFITFPLRTSNARAVRIKQSSRVHPPPHHPTQKSTVNEFNARIRISESITKSKTAAQLRNFCWLFWWKISNFFGIFWRHEKPLMLQIPRRKKGGNSWQAESIPKRRICFFTMIKSYLNVSQVYDNVGCLLSRTLWVPKFLSTTRQGKRGKSQRENVICLVMKWPEISWMLLIASGRLTRQQQQWQNVLSVHTSWERRSGGCLCICKSNSKMHLEAALIWLL